MRTKSLLETITDTQEHIHKELGVRQNWWRP
jgi:hypothetical protein